MRQLRLTLGYFALWSPVALGFAIALASTQRMTWPQALVAGLMTALPAALLGLGVIQLCNRVPWRDSAIGAFLLVHALAAAAFASLWAASILVQIWIVAPRAELTSFLNQGLAWQLVTGVITYAVLAGASYARNALRGQAEQAVAIERAETLRLRAELNALRSRLDPHFLFNVLQTIGALVRERPDQVHAALEHLSSLLRRRIDAAGGGDESDTMSLDDELVDVREYLALESLRFAQLETVEEIDPKTLALSIPTFTLQPLVENAIRHGLATRSGGGHGRLTIRSRIDDGSWRLSVADDGAGADPARFTNGNGVGISVLRERLRLRFADRAGLAVETRPGEGCTVTVRLPVEPDETP
jgi:signal transduction histidine kinase